MQRQSTYIFLHVSKKKTLPTISKHQWNLNYDLKYDNLHGGTPFLVLGWFSIFKILTSNIFEWPVEQLNGNHLQLGRLSQNLKGSKKQNFEAWDYTYIIICDMISTHLVILELKWCTDLYFPYLK